MSGLVASLNQPCGLCSILTGRITPSTRPQVISSAEKPWPMASVMSNSTSSKSSRPCSCALAHSASLISAALAPSGATTSQSSRLTALRRWSITLNKWPSFSSISANSSCCAVRSPCSADCRMRASLAGVRPRLGWLSYSWRKLARRAVCGSWSWALSIGLPNWSRMAINYSLFNSYQAPSVLDGRSSSTSRAGASQRLALLGPAW